MSFKTITDEIIELHRLKAADYASNEDPYQNFRENARLWGRLAWVEPLIRLSEKVFRLILFHNYDLFLTSLFTFPFTAVLFFLLYL